MQILIIPMYSRQELNSDSNYVFYSALVRGMARIAPTWQFVIVWPDAHSGYKYDDDGFFALPNVLRVPQRISPRKGGNATAYDPIYYDALVRQFGFDVAICALPEIAGWVKHAGENGFERASRPVTIADHHYTIHETLPYPWNTVEHLAGAQVMGATLADWNVFGSRYGAQLWQETAARWLLPSVVARTLHDSTIIPRGTLETTIQPRADLGAADARVCIVYNHRLQNYKNWRETFALLDQLYAENLPFFVRFTSTSQEKTSNLLDRPYVEMKLCATRDAYLDALARGDINTTNSQHETFCIAAVESMAFGALFIAPRALTFPEITNDAQDPYPFLFTSMTEQAAMLRAAIERHTIRREYGLRLADYVRATYTQDAVAAQWHALIRQETAKSAPHTPDDVREFVAQQMHAIPRDGMLVRDFYNIVAHKPVGNRVPFSSQSLTIIKLNRLVRAAGGRIAIVRGQQRVFAK